jgi:hypothetical protein
MESIGNHGLACLDATDWADYARYMQCQAQTIDTVLADQMALLAASLDRPTIVVGASANRTFATGTSVGNFFDTVLFVNNTFMNLTSVGLETFVNIGSPLGQPVVEAYQRGMYLIGGFTSMDATGAVTGFSQRILTVSAIDDSITGAPQVGTFTDNNPDANTAITAIGCSGAFTVVLRGINAVRIRHALSHTNAASTVTAIAANSLLWVTYLGPNELVEVP